MKKEKTLDEAKDEVSKQLLAAIKTGQHFVLLCSNGVPLLEKYYDKDKLPPEVLDVAALKKAIAADKVDDTCLGPLVKRGEADHPHANWGFIHRVHPSMRVVAVTKFAPDEYEEFLMGTLPMSQMQAIKLTTER